MFGEKPFGQFLGKTAATPSTANGSMPNQPKLNHAPDLSFKTHPQAAKCSLRPAAKAAVASFEEH